MIEQIQSLCELNEELRKKINKNYTGHFGDDRFTLAEIDYLFAAFTKLYRIIFADAPEKVMDDAIDVHGYMELFNREYQSRTHPVINITGELHR